MGVYGAKKVIAFTKAVLKNRKGASGDVAAESSAVEATKDDDADGDDEDQGGNEKAAQAQVHGHRRR